MLSPYHEPHLEEARAGNGVSNPGPAIVVDLIDHPGAHVRKGLEHDNPAGPAMVQVPCVEADTDRPAHVVVPHHADKEGDQVGGGHDAGSAAELGHQGRLRRGVELAVRPDVAIPGEEEGAVQDVGEDVGNDEARVYAGGQGPQVQAATPGLERLVVPLP